MILKTIPTSIFLLHLFLSSCTPISKEVEIRVRNTSPYTYTNVTVNTSGGENTYGDIPPGAASDYKVFDFAYSYAQISLQIDTVNYLLQPIDYVGEHKLQSGKYTYEISVYNTSTQQLLLNLVED